MSEIPTSPRRLLAVEAGDTGVAEGSLCDAAGTVRRLQGLIAAGWSVNRLADHLGRGPGSVRAIMNRARVRGAIVIAVRELYGRLAWTVPPQASSAQRREVAAAKDLGGRHGWLALVAGASGTDPDDDMDEPAGVPGAAGLSGEDLVPAEGADMDEVAVAEAMRGRRVHLTVTEQVEAVDRLTGLGRSLREIAVLLHTSPRTVSRRRSSGRDATLSGPGPARVVGGWAARRKSIPPPVSEACGRDSFQLGARTRGRS